MCAIISSEDSTSLIGDYVEVNGLSGLGLASHVSMRQILQDCICFQGKGLKLGS